MAAYEGADPVGVAERDGGEVQRDGAVALVEEAVEAGEQPFRAISGEFTGDREQGGGRRRRGHLDFEHFAEVPTPCRAKTRSADWFQLSSQVHVRVLSISLPKI